MRLCRMRRGNDCPFYTPYPSRNLGLASAVDLPKECRTEVGKQVGGSLDTHRRPPVTLQDVISPICTLFDIRTRDPGHGTEFQDARRVFCRAEFLLATSVRITTLCNSQSSKCAIVRKEAKCCSVEVILEYFTANDLWVSDARKHDRDVLHILDTHALKG
ncbi:hypothetical protein K439DRAFT_1610382 [Ramaria rubella]|nr:hypothetical protein K439DRAFT_1610382 [Ramaria rubella]